MTLSNVKPSGMVQAHRATYNFKWLMAGIMLAVTAVLTVPDSAAARLAGDYEDSHQFIDSDFGDGTGPTSLRYHRGRNSGHGPGRAWENAFCGNVNAEPGKMPDFRDCIEQYSDALRFH